MFRGNTVLRLGECCSLTFSKIRSRTIYWLKSVDYVLQNSQKEKIIMSLTLEQKSTIKIKPMAGLYFCKNAPVHLGP